VKITTIYSSMDRKSEHPDGSVQARIAADLDRFDNVMMLLGVLDEIRYHLQRNWNGEGFRVELEGEPGKKDYPSAGVYFDLPFDILELRVREHDWKDGGPCPKCHEPSSIADSVQWTTGERRLECSKCRHFFVQRY